MRWKEIYPIFEKQSQEIKRQIRCRAARTKIEDAERAKYDASIKQKNVQNSADNKIANAQSTLSNNSTS